MMASAESPAFARQKASSGLNQLVPSLARISAVPPPTPIEPVQSPAELAWTSRVMVSPLEVISPLNFTSSRSFMSALASAAILSPDCLAKSLSPPSLSSEPPQPAASTRTPRQDERGDRADRGGRHGWAS